ncbi:MAG: glycosyltransferase family 4 protein [Patescibacteria group bacterium]
MRVLYLFTGTRTHTLEAVRRGEDLGNGFWGMLRLPKFGVEAEFVELEQYLPGWLCKFLRRWFLGSYFAHIPFFLRFFSYDIVYTAGAFGSQLIHATLGIRKPLWVMFDFSIMGLLGKEQSFRQKLFRFLVSRCGGIVTLSLGEAEKLKSRFPHLAEKIAFIPYGLDIDFFKPQDVPEIMQIFVPGTDPDRDYKTLFAACKGLPVTVRFTTYEHRVQGMGALPENVVHKRLSIEELRHEYAQSAVVVIPLDTSSGLNDAMGVSVVQEALAMGKAIIASHTDTMASYIEDGKTGFLVSEKDVSVMRGTLEKVLSDKQLRDSLGREARTYAERHLDADKCTENLAKYFKELVANEH